MVATHKTLRETQFVSILVLAADAVVMVTASQLPNNAVFLAMLLWVQTTYPWSSLDVL